MKINHVAKSFVIALILVFLVCSLVACDPRRSLKDSEITDLVDNVKTIVLDENNWNSNLLYDSIDGRLIIHDDYIDDNPDQILLIELVGFKEELVNLFNHAVLVNNGGFYVYNDSYLIFINIDDESSNILSLNISIYSDNSIIIEPVYKVGIEYKTTGIILNLNLNMLEQNEYDTKYWQ